MKFQAQRMSLIESTDGLIARAVQEAMLQVHAKFMALRKRVNKSWVDSSSSELASIMITGKNLM